MADPLIGEPGARRDDSGESGLSVQAAMARGYRFPPLPAARREVAEISRVLQLLPGRPRVLVGEHATKANLLGTDAGELSQYRYIHLATHGVLGAAVPGLHQPALLLGAAADGDVASMFLTMEELSRLRLTADLVVLSACQTGLGEEIAGEGMLGLTRAVLHAGAASAVVSLWNVADEATATLMARFYAYLVKDGMDKARALQRAKLDFLREARGGVHAGPGARPSHPFFWAPFILVGDDSNSGRPAPTSPRDPPATDRVDRASPDRERIITADDGAQMKWC
jgi:CHAT domain-containing protein